MNRQGSISLFSLLSFSQRTEGSLACKFAGGVDGMHTGRQRSRLTSCQKKNNNEKLSCKTFKQIFVVDLFSLNDFGFCMENLHAKEPCHDLLRPYFVSSPLNSLTGCTKNVKVSCRQRHLQQAAKDPFLKALMARVHAPASSQ